MTPSAFLSPEEIDRLDLAYMAERRCSPQWRDFIAAMGHELYDASAPDEMRAFLRAVGRRFAAKLALPSCETLSELEAGMNAVWRQTDWGWTRLLAVDSGIAIVHGAYPDPFGDSGDPLGPGAAPAAMLEGVYGAWFQAQGSPLPSLRRITPSVSPLVLLHGR